MAQHGRVAFIGALSIALLISACGPSAPAASDAVTGTTPLDELIGLPSGEPVEGLTSSFDGATLADDTATVDTATIQSSLRAVESTDAVSTLRFNADAPAVRQLKRGQVVAFANLGIARVTNVHDEGGETIVTTSPATLGEYVRDGVLHWKMPVRFDNLPVEAYAQAAATNGFELATVGDMSPGVAAELAAKGKELTFKGTVNGFEISFTLTPLADQLKFSLAAKRSNVSVAAKGFVSTFEQEARLEYEDGVLTWMDAGVTGLKGEAEITWSAYQVGNEDMDKKVTGYEIPVSLPIPFMAGPVPMTLSLKAVGRVVPAFETEQGSSGGSFKVTYASDAGFEANGGAITPLARVVSFAADLGSTETVTAGIGPSGFAVGFEFPRLELALGHPVAKSLFQTYAFVTFNQYANGMFTPGTTLSADIPPCQRASLRMSAVSGYKFAVLGMAQLSDNTVLWEKSVDRYKDDRECTLTGQ